MKNHAVLFLGLVLMAGMTTAMAQDTQPDGGYYEFRFFKMVQGDQGGRFDQWAAKAIPILQRLGCGPVGVFSVVIGPDAPTKVMLLHYDSLAAAEQLWLKAVADSDWKAAWAAWENGPEQPYVTLDSFLLKATPYSPPWKAASDGDPRYFELRRYHSPTRRQLAALHERFGGAEKKIFHRSGIVPILYGDTVVGVDMPSLTYLTPFKTLADREAAWAKFGADPEWRTVSADSIQRGGQIVRNIDFWILRSSGYSQIK